MAYQASLNQSNFPFILSGRSFVKDSEVLLQDAGRTTVLAFGTVMAQVAATRKWVPLTDVTATTGAATARGIYVGEPVASADLVAGDVTGAAILVGGDGITVDTQQVVLENSLTLNTVVGATSVNARLIADDLANIGIFVESTIDIDELEN